MTWNMRDKIWAEGRRASKRPLMETKGEVEHRVTKVGKKRKVSESTISVSMRLAEFEKE